MNNYIPEIINPLKHAGTSKFERLADELKFDYVQIEERHEADYLHYAKQLMSSVQFYDQNNLPAGDWSLFFDTSIDQSEPHKALFIAFLRLLEALNEHANGLTKRHLDYYYKDVLNFTRKKATPKQAHLFFKCAKGLKTQFVAQYAKAAAGKNADGDKILFQLVQEIVVNKASVSSYFNVFKHNTDKGERLFAKNNTPYLEKPANGFKPFGEQQLEFTKDNGIFKTVFVSEEDRTMESAETGFALASPILRLTEGTRIINLKFYLGNAARMLLEKEDFTFAFSGPNGWYFVKEDWINLFFDTSTEILSIDLTLPDTAPAVINYDQTIHAGNYAAKSPILRILLAHKNNTRKYAYSELKNLKIKEVELDVDVTGFRSLIVQNDLSALDPSKPFRPFGPIPAIDNNFYVGHPEIFKHRLSNVTFDILWKDIPNKDFNKQYENFLAAPVIDNLIFKAEAAVLENKVWSDPIASVSLFDENNAKNLRSFSFNNIVDERKSVDEDFEQWNYKTHSGFMRFTLKSPDLDIFQAFGHGVYPKEVVANAKKKLSVNQPYVPVIKELRLNYKTAPVSFSDHGDDQFFHVTHFGQKNIPVLGTRVAFNVEHLIPQYQHEGELYIGLKEIVVPQSVSLLFQMAEGTGDANQSQVNSNVNWHYLSGDEWKPMDRLRISQDTTFGLLNSGIIRFDFPTDFDQKHHIMPDNQFWIKATIPAFSAGIDQIINVHAQAAEIIEVDAELNPDIIRPNVINRLEGGVRGISKVNQPYASFNGNATENESGFYARVSERLRHKDRGIMIFDYERLVLDAYPDLYKVKCLNHTNYQTEMVAGNVMLAVIPNLINRGTTNPFQPKLGMNKRREIYAFLRERISPFIYLRVENPIYEPIQLSFNVGFHPGKDEGYYGKKLHDELQAFLSPWAFENETTQSSSLVFGGELHKSVVLKFIEDLEYVDFVNDFNMYHCYQDPRVKENFKTEIEGINKGTTNTPNIVHHSVWHKEGTGCTNVKIAFLTDDSSAPNCLIEIDLRFLKGIIELPDEALYEKFIKQLTKILENKIKKGIQITKNLVQIIVKGIYYVDKILSIDFYKQLPNDFVKEDVDVAIAKSSRSIMVTSEQHRIGVYRAGDYKCEGNVMIGIGFMIVEADFIIPQIKEENYEYTAR